VTAEAATRLGIPVTVMPSEFTIGALVQVLADHYATEKVGSASG
jgi:hypothetical protein